MSQSHPGESAHHGELDPLLAFNAELAAAEFPQNPAHPTPSAAAAPSEDASTLRRRVELAERSLERARIEICALKSDLATLVTAVDDIKKRLSRRPEAGVPPPPARVPPRRGLLKVAALLLVCLMIGAAMWSLAPGMIEAPGRPTSEPSAFVETPTSVGTPTVDPGSATAAPAPDPAERDSVPR